LKNNYFSNQSTGSLLTRANWGFMLDDVVTVNSTNMQGKLVSLERTRTTMNIVKLPGFLQRFTAAALLFWTVWPQTSFAAPPNRIAQAVTATRMRVVKGNLHPLANAKNDRGAVAASMRMDYMLMMLAPSAAQQSELDGLLADQQNPSSTQFHKWLTPEDFGNRFGLSESDHSKVAAWLTSEGFTVNESGRGRNWVAFSGNAGQVSRSFRTSIHRFQVEGETHYANSAEPSVPEALAEVTSGFVGLHDFRLKSNAKLGGPAYTTASGAAHYLAPEDYGTIYNISPLYKAGFDGTGQSIAVVGGSAVPLSDLRAFKTRFNLPAGDPKVILYGGADPGVNGDQIEGNLDLEWSSAIAPKASLFYIYGQNPLTAIIAAVSLNVAPIISVSYGGCELNFSGSFYRSFAQQANAQGITIVVASGDAGSAGCDRQGSELFAARGNVIQFPSALPEVTSVGGTQFAEGSGKYWATTNTSNGGSALSYIPEMPWNESDSSGLIAGGGGASQIYPKPLWQAGPGVPPDGVRDTPDVSLTAALHDGYLVYFSDASTSPGLYVAGGTSASAPSLAGILAILNQYQVAKNFQSKPGLGNINPQLYRLAQAAPSAFHDITTGDNLVPCVQGSADCLTGFLGAKAGPGYDLATGLGSIDVNNLVTNWNNATGSVSVTVTADNARPSLNDSVTVTARVSVVTGTGGPTGRVDFSVSGISFGSVPLSYDAISPFATLTLPVGRIGLGRATVTAEYSGDATFSSGGATLPLQIVVPGNGAAAIVLSGPFQVYPATPVDPQGFVWQTNFTLTESAGTPAVVTGFTIDGQPQPLAQYFPTTNLQANSSLIVRVVFRNIVAFSTRTFGIQLIDASGTNINRQITVTYFPTPEFEDIGLRAFPLTVTQDTSNASCPWPVRLSVDDLGGFTDTITGLFAGSVSYSSQIASIFGTRRLETLGSLQGTLCLSGVTVPATETIEVDFASGITQQVTVTLLPPAISPAKLSASPANVLLTASPGKNGQSTIAVNLTDKTQPWTAAIFPANRTTGWLTTSQLSGTGPGQITLTATSAGYAPGAYRATILLQSPGALPQTVEVPVVFINGGSTAGTLITGAGNAAVPSIFVIAPGELLTVTGTNLANTTRIISSLPLPYTADGVSATVNGVAAPILYASPTQINLQVPYGVSAGAGVIGINNNGEVAGFPVLIAPAAPGIFTDAANNIVPNATVTQNGALTLYLTGAGDIASTLLTAFAPALNTPVAFLPRHVLPISATVGGAQVFIQYAGLAPGLIGTTQVNLLLPGNVPAGLQPVVITVNGVASNQGFVTVQMVVPTTTQP
jgi:uncharacterized protein (TIGR03437 family)